MGFYLRKAIRVGPIRFNLSRSGIGTSAGIKGLRLGSGPRGNYIHMGRKGIYYRKFSNQSSNVPGRTSRPSVPSTPRPVVLDKPVAMEEIESGKISDMTDSSSTELLAELNSKRKKFRMWPGVGISGFLAVLFLMSVATPIWLIVLIVLGVLCFTVLAYMRDQLTKSTVLFYRLDSVLEQEYQSFHNTFDNLKSCAKIWHVEAHGEIEDRKYHAGADKVIERKRISLSTGQPPFVKTNISVPMIPVGRQKLYFFPDRVLVFDYDGVGAVSYRSLYVSVSEAQFVETGNVLADSQVVGTTWQYVNKKGGPDKRFKDNPELPIVLYEHIHLTSPSGLNELIQVSRVGYGTSFKEAAICLQF